MSESHTTIPDKLFFKIGEVCDIVGVQAHVLRYWETEFPMLSPQKNKSGQRSYRKRDVEIALKIKQLLYKEMFTIAGARKKLQSDSRSPEKIRVESTVSTEAGIKKEYAAAPLFDSLPESIDGSNRSHDVSALTGIAKQLVEIRDMLRG